MQNETEKLNGYVLTEQDCFIGILYTDVKGVYTFIYGKYIPNSKIEIFINGVPSGEYQFNTTMTARDGSPYEMFVPLDGQDLPNNKLLMLYYDLKKGFEFDRVSDISNFVNSQFDNHLRDDEIFAKNYASYFGDTEPFQKRIRMKPLIDSPF